MLVGELWRGRTEGKAEGREIQWVSVDGVRRKKS